MIDSIDQVRAMKEKEFMHFGVEVVAYVRKVDMGGMTAYALHGADGQTLGIEVSEDLAALSARHKNLMPVMVH